MIINLRELTQSIVEEKLLVLFSLLSFSLAALVYANFQPNLYRAETLLVPVSGQQFSANENSFLDSISEIPGISRAGFTDSGVSDAERILAILESRKFIGEFIHNHQLMLPLMASKPSNASGAVVIDDKKYDELTSTWLIENNIGKDAPPTELQVYDAFRKIMRVNYDIDRGFIVLAIEWYDPIQISSWVNWLVQDLNEYVKKNDLQEAEQAIEFLKTQVSNTQLVDMKNIFYKLIETQTQTLMLADVREQYALQVIDPAVIPEVKVSPDRFLIVALGIALGFVVVMLLLLYKNLRNRA